MAENIIPVEWKGEYVRLLDQSKLPLEEIYLEIENVKEMWDAIKMLCVRGAPAIGIAAAYGVCIEMKHHVEESVENYHKKLNETINYLATSRPTAVNLFWALNRLKKVEKQCENKKNLITQEMLLKEAQSIEKDEEAACIVIGENLLSLLHDGMTLLTHCNTGGIATVRYGTALSPILLGKERGINFKVYADETRPLLQGARLTSWELQKAGVDVTLITDSMAGMLMAQNKIDAVVVGCDRIAANGDVANKIGTYSVAVLAKYHNIPFYVAGPVSTIDIKTATGGEIPIEERSPEEITNGFGKRTAPEGIKVYNPAFDITPYELITAIVTERGIIEQPDKSKIDTLIKNLGN